MPKLQKAISKKTGQIKFHINLPLDTVAEKGWKGGERFSIGFDKNGDLVLKEIK